MLNRGIKDVLLVSYGVGSTAEAITSIDSVEHIDVVDISEDILDMSAIIHAATGKFPLKDTRTEIHLEDGRFFCGGEDGGGFASGLEKSFLEL